MTNYNKCTCAEEIQKIRVEQRVVSPAIVIDGTLNVNVDGFADYETIRIWCANCGGDFEDNDFTSVEFN